MGADLILAHLDVVVVGERLGEGYDVITVTPLHPGS